MIIECSRASSPYATANGSETIMRLSTTPFHSALRKYCLFVRSARRRNADDRADVLGVDVAGLLRLRRATADAEKRSNRLDVLLRTFLQQAALERTMQIEHRTVETASCPMRTARFNTSSRHVDGPADVAVHDEPFAVRRGDGASRRAEVNATCRGPCSFAITCQIPFFAGDSCAVAYDRIPR